MGPDLPVADDNPETRASRRCKESILPFDLAALLLMAIVMVAVTAWVLR
jgi:hypothetical protein